MGTALTSILALLAALLGPTAGAQSVGTPDGRVFVEPGAEGGLAGLWVGLRGNVGDLGFDNTLEVGPDGFRVTNPPFSHAEGSGGSEYPETFGPPVASATIGTGGITEGVDRAGRLTVLGWPGPGHHDHVNFVHSTRGYPNGGAPANAGSFGGIAVDDTGSWLTPQNGWRPASQAYAEPDTETIVTVLENPDLGLEVELRDVVDPDDSLVARNFCFREMGAQGCDPTLGTFAYYANMNPTTGGRIPRAPSIQDAALDDAKDFGTVYDPGTSALLHFRPYGADPASASRLATGQPGVGAAEEAIRGSFGTGVYVAVAGQGEAGGFQAGLETVGLVRDEAEGTPALDPYHDWLDDGALSSSSAAFGKTAGGLAGLPPDDDGSYTVYLAAAKERSEARDLIREARRRGFAKIREESDEWWEDWADEVPLPATGDETIQAAALRGLMLMRTAQDRRTGAIVSAPTVQTPYRQAWVRDAGFFNAALVLGGHPEMARHYGRFLAGVYRLGGTWDTLYYTDGVESGFIWPYQTDSQGFAIWGLWAPFQYGGAGREYLEDVYPAIVDTARALMVCRDPTNGMQCIGPEDDKTNPYVSQGGQGAAAIYLGLRSAADAARVMGDDTEAEEWDARAAELRGAALEEVCDQQEGTCEGGRAGKFLVWPSRLVDPESDDPEVRKLAQSHMGQFVEQLDARSTFQEPEVGGFFQYPMESILALAPFWEDEDKASRLDGWMRWLSHDVADPGTFHFGERIFFCDGQGPFCEPGQDYLNSVGVPHTWSGDEMYLTAAFVYGLEDCADAFMPEVPC